MAGTTGQSPKNIQISSYNEFLQGFVAMNSCYSFTKYQCDVSIEVAQSLPCPRRTASSSCRVSCLHSLRAVRALVCADRDPRRPRNARDTCDARGLVVLAAAAEHGVEMWANRLFSPLVVSSFLLAPRGEASPFLRRSPALRPPAPRLRRRARHIPRAMAVRHTRRA